MSLNELLEQYVDASLLLCASDDSVTVHTLSMSIRLMDSLYLKVNILITDLLSELRL